jgi:hypothetical protein
MTYTFFSKLILQSFLLLSNLSSNLVLLEVIELIISLSRLYINISLKSPRSTVGNFLSRCICMC